VRELCCDVAEMAVVRTLNSPANDERQDEMLTVGVRPSRLVRDCHCLAHSDSATGCGVAWVPGEF